MANESREYLDKFLKKVDSTKDYDWYIQNNEYDKLLELVKSAYDSHMVEIGDYDDTGLIRSINNEWKNCCSSIKKQKEEFLKKQYGGE